MGVVTLVCVLTTLLTFMTMLRTESGRRIEFHYYLSAVKFLCKRHTTKFYPMDIVMPFVKVVYLVWMLILLIAVDFVYSAWTVFRRVAVSWP